MSEINPTLKTSYHSPEDLINYLRTKGRNHNYYKIYSSIERIYGWLEDGKLYLSRGNRWNDISDRRLFNDDSYEHINFGLCCSFSKSENVAMWMLYGKDENGAMLDITKGQIEAVINGLDHIEFGHFDNKAFVSTVTLEKKDIEIFRQDVLYYSDTDENGLISIKRSDERCDQVPAGVIDRLYIRKKYPWNYENECRFVIRVKRDLLKEHPDADTAAVAIPKKKLKDLSQRVYASPKTGSSDQYRDLILKKSKLGGEIDW